MEEDKTPDGETMSNGSAGTAPLADELV